MPLLRKVLFDKLLKLHEVEEYRVGWEKGELVQGPLQRIHTVPPANAHDFEPNLLLNIPSLILHHSKVNITDD